MAQTHTHAYTYVHTYTHTSTHSHAPAHFHSSAEAKILPALRVEFKPTQLPNTLGSSDGHQRGNKLSKLEKHSTEQTDGCRYKQEARQNAWHGAHLSGRIIALGGILCKPAEMERGGGGGGGGGGKET
eukprot:1155443-Pelagomonas_calceolata.AAC.6